jgi:hypothetical protein
VLLHACNRSCCLRQDWQLQVQLSPITKNERAAYPIEARTSEKWQQPNRVAASCKAGVV